MSVSRVKTWVAGETLSASDLNAEFNNILTNGQSVPFPRSENADFNGKSLILDADADSSLTAATDDRADLALSGTTLFRFDGTVATPVNGIDFVASAAGSDVAVNAVGTDTDISIDIVPKGAGVVKIGGTTIPAPGEDAFILAAQVFM